MTAVASEQEMDGVPHHMLGILEPWETGFDVRRFKDLFWQTVNEISSRGVIPIAVGGTNYYLETILEKYLPKQQETFKVLEQELIKRIQQSLRTLDFNEMLGCLKEADPEKAKLTIKNEPNNALARPPASLGGGVICVNVA